MIKFQFKIRSRSRVIVENLTIAGKDQPDAERKLLQMYQGCEILNAIVLDDKNRVESAHMDNILALIAQQDQDAGPTG